MAVLLHEVAAGKLPLIVTSCIMISCVKPHYFRSAFLRFGFQLPFGTAFAEIHLRVLITARLQEGGAFPWKLIYLFISSTTVTITGCKTMTSIVLQISKIHYKLSEICSLNHASPETKACLNPPECVLVHTQSEKLLKSCSYSILCYLGPIG